MGQIVHSDAISLSTKGFGDTIDISDSVEKIRNESGIKRVLQIGNATCPRYCSQ
jgi:hypothetical protein